jgi:hypothetical protein
LTVWWVLLPVLCLATVGSTHGTQPALPLRSDILLVKGWAHGKPAPPNSENALAIRQSGDSVLIQTGSQSPRRIEKEGLIPVGEYLKFWDSLNVLGVWRLRNEYAPAHEVPDNDTWGFIRVSTDDKVRGRANKVVAFQAPQWTAQEFWDVYYLLNSMERFARPVPDSIKDTLTPRGRSVDPPVGD